MMTYDDPEFGRLTSGVQKSSSSGPVQYKKNINDDRAWVEAIAVCQKYILEDHDRSRQFRWDFICIGEILI